MRQLILLVAIIALSPLLALGQARTAERIVSVPFSSLSSSQPDGSVRIVINGTAGTPCTVGSAQVSATKLNGVWVCTDFSASSAAPLSATYITQTPHPTLTGEQALSLLATGLLKSTTVTGAVSIAVAGTDYLTPTGNGSQLTALNATQLTSGTIPDGRFPAVLPAVSGANLAALNASNLDSGTVPDARFPATLPVASGVNLTALNASNLGSGTVPDARFPATLPAASGVNLTALNASALTSGTVAPARLGTGSGGATKFLREDSTWQVVGGGGDALVANPLSQFAATTSAQLAGVITNETGTNLLVYSDNPVIVTPTIASFLNMGHDHTNAVGGGQLTDAALSAAVGIAKGGTGQTSATAAFNALDPLTTKGDIIGHNGTNSVRLAVGTDGQCLKGDSAQSTGLVWGTCGVGTGDVVGPASAVDNAIARFDTTTGKLIQNSSVTIDDSGNLSTAGTVTSGAGGSVAGTVELGEGTAPSLVANTFSVYAPTDVAAGGLAYVVPAAAATGLMYATNASGIMTITHDGASQTKTFTNTTIDAEGTGNSITEPSKVWLTAAGCVNTTAGSMWDLPTSTPAVAACVTGTNIQKGVLQFADTSGGFSAQNHFLLAADFTGAVDARIVWRTAATTGNAKWSLSTICTAVDATETDDPAFNTASTVTTAAPGTANRLQTSSISSVTITGCTAGKFLHVKLFRDGNDAADTIAATAELLGVEITLRRAM